MSKLNNMGICFFLVISVENNNISRAERKPDVTWNIKEAGSYASLFLDIIRECSNVTVVILCYI